MPEAPAEAVPAEVPTVPPVAGESTASDPETPEPGAEALRDAGKQALDRMKAERQAAKEEARAARAEAAEWRAKAEGKEAEFAAEQERRKVESAANEKANQRILKAEIRGAAAKALADPADALLYLDLSKFEVGNDGEVDTAAITSALADLVEAKPYLAAQGGTGVVFESPAAHRAAAKPGQLTQADLKNMTPSQINTARAEGRLNDVLGFKS